MRCTLDGANARVLAKAIQSLSKFGTELFIEADIHGLQLRSLNATRSAVGSFRFNKNFFECYQVKAGDENYCKIAMKACLTVFRNMKQVEQCEMQIIVDQAKFQVQLKCRLETVKNALISVLDEENITSAVSPDNMSNFISGSHKIFTEISTNFNAAEEEITLEAQGDFLTVKNYIEGSRVNDKFMRSQLKLASAEFETYKIAHETTVTFCLKEFRAFLLFAETLNENMVLNFDECGSPIFMSIKKYDQVECTLIMSTLSPEDVSFYDDCRQSEVTDVSRNRSSISAPQKRNLSSDSVANDSCAPKIRKRIEDATTLSMTSTVFSFNTGASNNNRANCQSVGAPRNLTNRSAGETGDHHNELLSVASSSANSVLPSHSVPRPSEVLVSFRDTETNKDEDPETEEFIPQSPQRQMGTQLRSIFSRCFESTYVPRQPSPNSMVYVPNSDSED